VNDIAVRVLGDEALKDRARASQDVAAHGKIDWFVKKSVRAERRIMVKRIFSELW
jgi:hypothetical protein